MRHCGALLAVDSSAEKRPDGGQDRLRDTLTAAAAGGSDEAAALLDGPEVPGDAIELFGWWQEINAQRGSNGFGLGPLLWSEIRAWAELMRRRPTPGELALLLLGDAHYLEGMHDGFADDEDEDEDADASHEEDDDEA
jgi:hypothetical protein